MNRSAAFAAVLIMVAFSTLCPADDWPRFLGPKADGISAETGLNKNWKANPPKTLWKVELSDEGYGGPSAADGKVFILDHKEPQDLVRAFDLATGKEVWSYSYDEPGKKHWGFTRATPTFDEGKLYTLSRYGQLLCLDAKTGKVLWQKDIIAEFSNPERVPRWQLAGSPILDGDKLIVCPGGEGASVVALDKKTGNLIWKGGGSDKPGYATPVLATINGQKQYVIFTATTLMGVDAANGKSLWSYPWKTGYDINAATPIVTGNSVFVTSSYKTGCALFEINRDKVTPLWNNKTIQSEFSTPVLYQSILYCTSRATGELICLDAKTGQDLWRKGGFEMGAVAAVDGVLLALTGKEGELVMVELNPKEYMELGRITPLGGQSWTAPIIADGKVIVRNTQAMACLELKPSGK